MLKKESRKVIGTFSQVANFIRSFTQVFFDHVRDTNNDFWQWILAMRKFLNFILMPEISKSQLVAMNNSLDELMNIRLKLTRQKNDNIHVLVEPDSDDSDIEENDETTEKTEKKQNKKSKYVPPVTWKEHYLSHYVDDIQNLAPLPFLSTDRFESKVNS